MQGNSVPCIERGGDFRDLVRQSTIFADKSRFIKDIIEDGDKVILLAMPRRWGKSVNLDMLKRFLEIPVDGNGEALNTTDKKSTENYRIFHADCVLKPNEQKARLAISQSKITVESPENMAERIEVDALTVQGTFPVIHIDFKGCRNEDYNGVLDEIRGALRKCFEMHSYLKESDRLDEEQRELVRRYTGDISSQSLDRYTIKSGLYFLSKLLHAHHNKKVWILIDEYDAGANAAYQEFNNEDLRNTINLFAGIYTEALKSNPHLEKGVLTGVQYIAQSGMLSGLNNLGKYDFTSAKYAQHYGLDQDEVDHFFSHFEVPSEFATNAKQWYNGYNVPRYLPNRSTAQPLGPVAKYNVWSIVSYLIGVSENGDFSKFKSYWEKSGNIDFMKPLFKQTLVREAIEKLVNGDSILLYREADFSVEDFMQLKAMLEGGNKEITQDGLTILLSYLWTGGYLTLSTEGENHYRLPNREITYEMGKRLIKYYQNIYTIAPEKLQQATDALQSIMEVNQASDIDESLSNFHDRFKEVIRSIRLVNDSNAEGVFTNEDIIHSILNYIALQTQHTTMGSEVYMQKLCSGDLGRVDLKMTQGKIGMILEVKCISSQEGSNIHMEEALGQAKTYRNVLKTDNNIFLAINVAKKASKPEQRSVELLCTAELFGEERTLGINAVGEHYTVKRRQIG